MIKEFKHYMGHFMPFRNREKQQNNFLGSVDSMANIRNVINAIVGNWYSNPMSLYSIAPVNQAINAYFTPIDGMDILLKKRQKNTPDAIVNNDDEFSEFMQYKGGYYFNNKMISIKDILKKLIIANALYYQYFIIYNKEGFFDIILNDFDKSRDGKIIKINYNNTNYTFYFDPVTGDYKSIIKGLYGDETGDSFEYTLFEYCDELLDSNYIAMHKTPLYPILPHLAIYLKASYANLYNMTEMQIPKGILKFANTASNEKLKLYSQNLKDIMAKGGTLSLEQGIEYQDISKTLDGDYKDITIQVENAVYHLFGIPLVLIRTEASTYDNYKTSYSIFIEQNVQSKLKKALKVVNEILISKIHENEDLYITVDWNDLFVIKERKKDIAIDLKNAGIISINEAREDCGRINADDGKVSTVKGGEDILVPNNLVKLGETGDLKGLYSSDNGELVSG